MNSQMNSLRRFKAIVEEQLPAVNERAQFIVVGQVTGTHDECWKQAKAMTAKPVIQFTELKQ